MTFKNRLTLVFQIFPARLIQKGQKMDKFRISGKQFPKRPNGNHAMLRDASGFTKVERKKTAKKFDSNS